MPPKPKFTQEEIVDASIRLIEEKGAKALTARELGSYLGSSSCPIFTVFADMDELHTAVTKRAKDMLDEYMAVAENYTPSYKMRGLQWVKFSAEHPKLFEMLFVHETGVSSDIISAASVLAFGIEKDIEIIRRDYNATEEQARRLSAQMWIYTFGLCVIMSKNLCNFTMKEIGEKLGEIFNGMVYVIKNVPSDLTNVTPVPSEKFRSDNYPDLSGKTDCDKTDKKNKKQKKDKI